jgi:hypothetical protein
MRAMTIDLCHLQQALEAPGALEHYLDLHSGEILGVDPEQPDDGATQALAQAPERFAPIEPLDTAERLAMREDFLHHLRDPYAHPLLAAALASRRPLRAFGYELEQFPRARADWQVFEQQYLRDTALNRLHELGIEPVTEAQPARETPTGIPAGVLRRLQRQD